MKKSILSLFIIFSFFKLYPQGLLKQITKTFDNGQPMFIDYLDKNSLKSVKKEIFNEAGQLIFRIFFNPETGIPDGDFFDLINKGHFNNGELNCENCMLVEENTPTVFTYNHNYKNTLITKGNVVNGRLIGKVKYFRNVVKDNSRYYNKTDWKTTRKYIVAGAPLNFRAVKTYKLNSDITHELIPLDSLFYNSNGALEGNYHITKKDGWHFDINVKNGITKSFVLYDKNDIIKDSLSNYFDTWKVNYKYVKNDGLLIFVNPKFLIFGNNGDELFTDEAYRKFIYYYNNYNGIYFKIENNYVDGVDKGGHYTSFSNLNYYNGVVLIGGKKNYTYSVHYHEGPETLQITSGGFYNGLNNKSGIYSIPKNDVLTEILQYDAAYYMYDYVIKYNRRNKNFLVLIYNYLMNDNATLKKRISDNIAHQYISTILSDSIANSFKKYLKVDTLSYLKKVPWKKIENEENSYYITLEDFFVYIISITDYFKAIQESIQNKETEIQEIWVWNQKTKKYDKIDLDNLIKIAKEKDHKIAKRIELEKERKRKEGAKKINDITKHIIKNASYSKSKTLKRLKKYIRKKHNLFVKKITKYNYNYSLFFISLSFSNIDDLNKFKKNIVNKLKNEACSFADKNCDLGYSHFFYEDIDNLTLYYSYNDYSNYLKEMINQK